MPTLHLQICIPYTTGCWEHRPESVNSIYQWASSVPNICRLPLEKSHVAEKMNDITLHSCEAILQALETRIMWTWNMVSTSIGVTHREHRQSKTARNCTGWTGKNRQDSVERNINTARWYTNYIHKFLGLGSREKLQTTINDIFTVGATC